MNIDIPQPTVLDRLKRDVEEARYELAEMKKTSTFETLGKECELEGYIRGLVFAITNLELNQ